MRAILAALAVIAGMMLAISCSGANPVGPTPVTSTTALVAALQQQGATARLGEVLPLDISKE